MNRDTIVIGDGMDRKTVIAALANMAALDQPSNPAYRRSARYRQKAIGLPSVAPHATDTSIPAVAAAIAKRERKAAKLKGVTPQ